jgi:hypothetical protein
MKDSEEIIQERFDRLQSGEPLADCLEGLTEAEAELVRRAATLQQVELPAPTATAVTTQRAAIVSAAQSSNTGNVVAAQTMFTTPLVERLGQIRQALFPHRKIVAGLSLLLLIAFAFFWYGRGQAPEDGGLSVALPQDGKAAVTVAGEMTETKMDAAADDTAETKTDTAVPDPAASDSNETSAAAIDTAAAIPAPPHQLFMPLLNTSLLVGPAQAALHNLRGLVEVNNGNGPWTAVDANTNLPAGSRIRTSRYSSASLTFYDGSQALLGPQAELALDQVNALRPEAGFRTVVMTQWAGESEHKVQLRHDGRSRYEVNTATGAGIARGTQFRVSIAADGRAAYTVSEGKVDVSNNGRTISVVAGQTTHFTDSEPPAEPSFIITGTGTVTQMGETWVIAGQTFTVTATTLIYGEPEVGDLVYVDGHLVENGNPPVADRIQRLDDDDYQFTFTGEVEEIGSESWLVSGLTINLTADTQIDPEIGVGDAVQVVGFILQLEGHLVATAVTRPEDDEKPFEFVGVVQNISAGAWTISGITIGIDEETEIEEGITVGDTVKVNGIILANDTWLAEEIEQLVDDNATFTFTGTVMNIDPWLVGGIGFEVAEWAQIDPGIESGDTVRVSGVILADGTWLATEIELQTGNVLQIVFVGEVNNLDPWVISGLPISSDENTLIVGEIAVGDLVRVTAWIRDDGTWLATHILLLDSDQEQECVAITAVVTGINGDEITLGNGQTILLHDDLVIDGELRLGSVILITACVQEDGTIVIVSIIVIYTPPPPPPPGADDDNDENGNDNDENDDDGNDQGGGSVTICHKPDTPAEKTKTLPQSALSGHLGHGDTMGPCP